MFENEAFEHGLNHTFLFRGELRDSFKLEAEIAIRTALIGAEDQHICTHLQSDSEPSNYIQRGLRRAVLVYSFLTLKERDVETDLDYFLARSYTSIQGRFTSADVFKGGPDELYGLGKGDEVKQALPYADISSRNLSTSINTASTIHFDTWIRTATILGKTLNKDSSGQPRL